MAYLLRVYRSGRMGFEREIGTVIADDVYTWMTRKKLMQTGTIAVDVIRIADNWEAWNRCQ